jgi:hypothetical protein
MLHRQVAAYLLVRPKFRRSGIKVGLGEATMVIGKIAFDLPICSGIVGVMVCSVAGEGSQNDGHCRR